MQFKKIIYIYLLASVHVFSAFNCSNRQMLPKPEKEQIQAVYRTDSVDLNFASVRKDYEPKLSDDFKFYEDSYFLVISNLGTEETEKIIAGTVTRASDCFYNDYFGKKPDEVTTIFLFKDDKSYRWWAKKLFDDDDLSRFGYYKPIDKVMLMNISTGTGTLVHEMTHALVRYDFPDIPSWLNEGLGSLYERCSLNNNEILGYVNWRLPELQDAVKDGSYTSLDALLKTNYDEFYGSSSAFNYAQARYLCMFLQEKKLLKKFYKSFRDSYSEDNTGKKQIESVYGKSLSEIEEEYLLWVKGLKYE